MKLSLFNVLAGALVSLTATAALAQGGLRIDGRIETGGNGCPQGTVSTSVAPDGSTVSILFDEYIAQAGGYGPSLDRKSCNVSIPVRVPQGYSVAVFKVDVRGFTSLPWGTSGQFDASYFFAGQAGPRARVPFRNGDHSFETTNRIGVESLVWSRCGESVNLRANTSIRVMSRNGAEAYAQIDSIDASNKVVYHIQWKRCY